MEIKRNVRIPSLVRTELVLGVSTATAVILLIAGKPWLSDLSNVTWFAFLFSWIFVVMLWSSFAVVRHAECLATLLGEPYGTLILTLAVVTIEVVMIAAVMLTGGDNPTLGRDTMFSVLMIVLNGIVGLALLLGGLRHHEQIYNLQGANAYLGVIVPLMLRYS